MKYLKKLYQWFIGLFIGQSTPSIDGGFIASVKTDIFKHNFVDDFPEDIVEKKVYIVGENNFYWVLVFKCPCGCSKTINLNLLKDASPNWKFTIGEDNLITIRPSIWRNTGCKSHFFITEGSIIWA